MPAQGDNNRVGDAIIIDRVAIFTSQLRAKSVLRSWRCKTCGVGAASVWNHGDLRLLIVMNALSHETLNPPNCPGHFDIRFSLFLVLLSLVVLGGNWAGWTWWLEKTRAKSNAQGGFRLPLTPSVFDSVATIGVICGAGRNYIIIPFAPQLGKRTNESTKPTQLYAHISYERYQHLLSVSFEVFCLLCK